MANDLKDDLLVPAEAREMAYSLLSQRSPAKVVIDVDLRPGQWYVVRAPFEHELELLKQKGAA